MDADVASNTVYTQRDMDEALAKERALHEEALATLRHQAETNATKRIASFERHEERHSPQRRVYQESNCVAPAHLQSEAKPSPSTQSLPLLSQHSASAYQLAYHIRDVQDRAEDRVREEYLMRMRKAERERDIIAVLAATGYTLPKFPGSL